MTLLDELRAERAELDQVIAYLERRQPAVVELMAPAEPAPIFVKRLPKATGNGKGKAKAAKNGTNGKRPRLTDEQRAAIRKALATEKIAAVCERFGVSYPTVKKIRDELGNTSSPPPQRVVEPKPAAGPVLRCHYCGRGGTHPKQCDHCKKDRV